MSTSETAGPSEPEARFREVYNATYADLVRFVQRRVDPSHAEDVVADAFLVAWRRVEDLPTELGEARAWLFGVAQRVLLNGQRSEQRRHALTIRIADELVAAGDEGLAGVDPEFVARRLDLVTAWRRLAPVHQETLSLAVWDGLTGPQAAAVLGISPVAYRLRLTRARRALRRHIDLAPPPAPHRAVTVPLREGSSS
jgi:RNA polymerase sigma-70 factor (ECF subfamily)